MWTSRSSESRANRKQPPTVSHPREWHYALSEPMNLGGVSPVCVADLTRDHEGQRHYVFVSIGANASSRTLEVVDIGNYSRGI